MMLVLRSSRDSPYSERKPLYFSPADFLCRQHFRRQVVDRFARCASSGRSPSEDESSPPPLLVAVRRCSSSASSSSSYCTTFPSSSPGFVSSACESPETERESASLRYVFSGLLLMSSLLSGLCISVSMLEPSVGSSSCSSSSSSSSTCGSSCSVASSSTSSSSSSSSDTIDSPSTPVL
uniref:Uncharacterized protein n=1 Tax=Anopheles melas TaxID=34690 RepID=A0A182TJI7_9DIPT